jgi:hypothetical protein
MGLRLFFCVQQHDAMSLTMQVNNRGRNDKADIGCRRSGKIIDGGIEAYQTACARENVVEIYRQRAVDEPAAHELSERNMRPIELCLLKVTGDQGSPLPGRERFHARAVF